VGAHSVDAPQRSTTQLAANALVITGLAVIAVSLVLPFASNEADCLDHCADAHRYFVWNPLDNIGAPFSIIGVVASLALWRSARRRRRAITWVGSFCGWIGIVVLSEYTPEIIEELYLYGGPALEMTNTTWILFIGWTLLWIGALISSPRPEPPAAASHEPGTVQPGG